VGSLRGTIGGEKEAVKQSGGEVVVGPFEFATHCVTIQQIQMDPLPEENAIVARLFCCGATFAGVPFGFGTPRSPVIGRERDAPEARRGLIELDAYARFALLKFTDVNDTAIYFVPRLYVSKAQTVANRNHLLQEYERSMRVYDLRYGLLREGGARCLLPGDNDMDGQEKPLTAAKIAGFERFGLGRIQNETLQPSTYRPEGGRL
jgi:hypothetical protein